MLVATSDETDNSQPQKICRTKKRSRTSYNSPLVFSAHGTRIVTVSEFTSTPAENKSAAAANRVEARNDGYATLPRRAFVPATLDVAVTAGESLARHGQDD